MKRERDLLNLEIRNVKLEILYEQTQTIRKCDDTYNDVRKELAVFTQHSDESLADSQKKLNRSLQVMEKKFKRSQKDLNLTFQEFEEKVKGLAREAGDKSAGMVESLKSEVEKQENELAAQKSILEAQQSSTQKLLQDVVELRQKLEKKTRGYKLVTRPRIRTLALSRLSQEPGSTSCRRRYHGWKHILKQPTWKRTEVEMKRKIETDKYLEEIRDMKYWRLLEKAYYWVKTMGYEIDTLMCSVTLSGFSPQSGFWDGEMLQSCQDPAYKQWSWE